MEPDKFISDPKANLDLQENIEEDGILINSLGNLLRYVIQTRGPEKTGELVNALLDEFKFSGVKLKTSISTPYLNTIAAENEPAYPGDREVERRIKSLIRWNALAMVTKANRENSTLGGHISTFASCATLYEVGFNHFFRGSADESPGDMVYFQGHASPGIYSRAYLERRIHKESLHHFRRELSGKDGVCSYPHPYLMPDFWQFPTVSMGLGPIMSIYQARFNRYLRHRGFQSGTEPKVWCFIGDGESDEPESLGALTLASRENLDNLIWVINCNLQRLDGPVRGNGKIIQELEGAFRGAGWNVIKVIWGSDWDPLLRADKTGLLARRMEEVVDGDYQKYTVEPGSYTRRHFFGKYQELLALVNHLSDDQIRKLMRGGHDAQKVYAAYKAAIHHKGSPTVILAKTIKGYGLGEAGEGRNVTHQQKKMNEKELREFRDRFRIPISDEEIVDAPFYRPDPESAETKYLLERRKALNGFLPSRTVKSPSIEISSEEFLSEFYKGSETEVSTTMAFVRLLTLLLRNPDFGKRIVPIIPDEARTFGMDSLFRQYGIYSPKGQLYQPVDRETLLYYKEAVNGQLLEEGITEAGAMSSFIAAGTSYANHGIPMIPFYIYYSMFGFQRIGDLIWAAADMKTRGFLLGATAGRTTLNGEGLQHADGHSQLMASTVPTLMTYDPAFSYEIATIIWEGIRRMYVNQEDIFYYLTLQNENYSMPEMPQNVKEGILNGIYKFKISPRDHPMKAQLFGSGSILRETLRAQEILSDRFQVAADVWSVTSYKLLRGDAVRASRENMLHPEKERKKSYLEQALENERGVFVAASDHIRMLPDQIAPWVPGGLTTLGTDGFGRSDTRPTLRRYFEVDAESIVIATLHALSKKGEIPASLVTTAIQELNFDPEKLHPFFL